MDELYAGLVFPTPLKKIFYYSVPVHLQKKIQIGTRCSVSFKNKQTIGLVINLNSQISSDIKNIKTINSLLDEQSLITSDLLKLGLWISKYYYCSLGEAFFSMLPISTRRVGKIVLTLTEKGLKNELEVKKILEDSKITGITVEDLKGKVKYYPELHELSAQLLEKDLAQLQVHAPLKKNYTQKETIGWISDPRRPELLNQQKSVIEALSKILELGVFKSVLLQGVTGSGKTEVYLRLIEKVIQLKKQTIVLIPEISLTPQTLSRFIDRFGKNQVSVFHSKLTPLERDFNWHQIFSGYSSIALGTRSALFAPTKNLGLIIVDEEHDPSYKQNESPRYHARDTAIKRAQLNQALVVLGSATPSLETIYNTKIGKYDCLYLPNRIHQRVLPKMHLIDLREEMTSRQAKEIPIFSLALEEAMKRTLSKGDQVILFLNRRGFNPVSQCLKCGKIVYCPHCSIAVTYYQSDNCYICHYCNWQGKLNEKCLYCGETAVYQTGIGTERVEKEVIEKFSGFKIDRMDTDSTRKRKSYAEILQRFLKKETHILIGTQMIAKGHDFPDVTLVGILRGEIGLSLPDFRAAEKNFNLLVQVSGRAGRFEKEGHVFLQTFNADHLSIQKSMLQDVDGFSKAELSLRKQLLYPPYVKLGLIIFEGHSEDQVLNEANQISLFLKKIALDFSVDVLGPAPAPIPKLRNFYRFQILLKCQSAEPLRSLVEKLDEQFHVKSTIRRIVDFDPQNMM